MINTLYIFILVFCFCFYNSVLAQVKPDNYNSRHINAENKLAVEGYDLVAYFTQNKAVKGMSKYIATIDGVKYQFVSDANKVVFIKNPTKYLPQYGGWCAYAMGEKGEKVTVNPETFKIISGKLYLFYNAFFNNTLKSWNENEINLKVKADANWLKTNK